MPKTLPHPTVFAFVHGAWHGAWCWEKVRQHLQEAGFQTIAMDLPIEDPTKDFDDYASMVIDALQGSEDIVLVGHSRGANVIPLVANRTPTVKRLIYLCAPLPNFAGYAKIFSDAPPRNTPMFKSGIRTRANGMTYYDRSIARQVFYNECSPAVGLWASKLLRDQRRMPTTSAQPVSKPAVPASYIYCSNDRVIYPEWSQYVSAYVLNVTPVELAADHSPFLSSPELLARTLMMILEQA